MSNEMDKVVDENGEVLLSLEECATPEDLEKTILGVITGDVTLAQYHGFSADNLYAMANMGYDYLEEGKLEEARKVFEGLTALNPHDSYFQSALGAVYMKSDLKDKAIERFLKAVALDDDDLHSWTACGELLLERAGEEQKAGRSESAVGSFGQAVDCLRRAIELDPTCQSGPALRAAALVNLTTGLLQNRVGQA